MMRGLKCRRAALFQSPPLPRWEAADGPKTGLGPPALHQGAQEPAGGPVLASVVVEAVAGLGDRHPAIPSEAEAGEAEEQHGPSGGFGTRTNGQR